MILPCFVKNFKTIALLSYELKFEFKMRFGRISAIATAPKDCNGSLGSTQQKCLTSKTCELLHITLIVDRYGESVLIPDYRHTNIRKPIVEKDKRVERSFYPPDEIFYTGKTTSLYGIRAWVCQRGPVKTHHESAKPNYKQSLFSKWMHRKQFCQFQEIT